MAASQAFITKKVEYYTQIFQSYASTFAGFSSMEYLPMSIYDKALSAFAKYVKQILKLSKYKEILMGVFANLTDGEKWECISELMVSDLDCFTDWYLMLLQVCMASTDIVVSNQATALYNFRKSSFNKIETNKKEEVR